MDGVFIILGGFALMAALAIANNPTKGHTPDDDLPNQ